MTATKILLGILMCISLTWGSLNPRPYDKHEPTQHIYTTGNYKFHSTYGEFETKKEAMVQAINQFLIWYNENNRN